MSAQTVAIIPARGGSKRIPGKNKKLFAGKPIISFPIQVAIESGLFDTIIVSTDDEELVEIALKCGAEVPFRRPVELADDHTATAPVIIHALEWLSAHDRKADYFCCIYPTTPFLQKEYLQKGYEVLRKKRATISLPVTTFSYPIFRAFAANDEGKVQMFFPEFRDTRSQDLQEAFHDAGQFYWGDTKKFLTEKTLYAKETVPVMLPRRLVHDIDTPEDWEIAERFYNTLAKAQ